MGFLCFSETHILTQAPTSRGFFLKILVWWCNTAQNYASAAIRVKWKTTSKQRYYVSNLKTLQVQKKGKKESNFPHIGLIPYKESCLYKGHSEWLQWQSERAPIDICSKQYWFGLPCEYKSKDNIRYVPFNICLYWLWNDYTVWRSGAYGILTLLFLYNKPSLD